MNKAYSKGFAAACLRYGVDPRGLVKAAANINGFLHPFSRYMQLLRGGNKSMRGMRSLATVNQRLSRLASDALAGGNKGLHDKIRKLLKQIRISANSTDYYALPDDLMSQLASFGYRPPAGMSTVPAFSKITFPKGPGAKSFMSVSSDVRDELKKVVAARYGTVMGTLLGGGTLAAVNAIPGEKKRKPRKFYNHFLDND